MTNTNEHLATLRGYTQRVNVILGPYDLTLLVHQDTDFDSEFKAYDVDEQEYIKVKGWLIEDLETV